MAVKEIAIDVLSAPEQTQPRVEIDQDLVAEYAELIARGVELPPIDVFDCGNKQYVVVDGFHRVLAHEEAGIVKIRCTIHKGSLSDASWFSYAANQAHGKRRTSADKKKAILAALRHKNGAKMSDSQLGEYLGLDHKTIAKYRAKLEATWEIPKSDERTGADGRTTNTANIGRKVKAKTPVQEPVVDAEDEEEIEEEDTEDEAGDSIPDSEIRRRPSDAMRFAYMAAMDLEQIRKDDPDRMAAFAYIKLWIKDNETKT